MMALDNLKPHMLLRKISRISAISVSGYYYHPRKRMITRLDPSVKERIKVADSGRPTYGYRRVWAILRNSGTHVNRKTVGKVLKDSNLNLSDRRHRGRTKSGNLFESNGPDQLWETDITYIPTESGITYLMCIDPLPQKFEHHYANNINKEGSKENLDNAKNRKEGIII